MRRCQPLSSKSLCSFFAVNAGADYAHLDEAHIYWEADRAFQPGSWGYVGSEGTRTHRRIFASNEDPLFQDSREGMERYQFDVPDGTYEVTLGFAEGDREAKAGKRVFSVRVNGREVFRDLDLFAEFGAYTAISRSVPVEATSGTGITIEFAATAGKASIAAIMVRR